MKRGIYRIGSQVTGFIYDVIIYGTMKQAYTIICYSAVQDLLVTWF